MPDKNARAVKASVHTRRTRSSSGKAEKPIRGRTPKTSKSSIPLRSPSKRILATRNRNETEKEEVAPPPVPLPLLPSPPVEKPVQKKVKITLDPSWKVSAVGGHVRIDRFSSPIEEILQKQKTVGLIPGTCRIVGSRYESSSDGSDSSLSDVENDGPRKYIKIRRIKPKRLTVAEHKASDSKLRLDNSVSLKRVPKRVLKLLQNPRYFLDTVIANPQHHVVPAEYLPTIINNEGSSENHKCTQSCGSQSIVPDNVKRDVSPLAVPFYYGWMRQKEKSRKGSTRYRSHTCVKVYYTTPCGVSLFKYDDIRKFLKLTSSPLEIDSFCFLPTLDCLNELPPSKPSSFFVFEADISNGQELRNVERVNSLDLEPANALEYVVTSVLGPNMTLNNENPFLTCCECEDDCRDKTKCNCWQLTLENELEFNPKASAADTGYDNKKKLGKKLRGGIFECNKGCRCKRTCINRVVQNGLTWRLQVYKTRNRGYAVRAMEEIPRGSFVCIYAGEIMNHVDCDLFGKKRGSGYSVNLDLIEAYEPRHFISKEDEKELTLLQASRKRMLLGLDDDYFAVDAKRKGNVGRYFNHSRCPNLFVQPVFVDTHDLRLPWVAFFTSEIIKCGAELTWDYGYDQGYYDYMNFVL